MGLVFCALVWALEHTKASLLNAFTSHLSYVETMNIIERNSIPYLNYNSIRKSHSQQFYPCIANECVLLAIARQTACTWMLWHDHHHHHHHTIEYHIAHTMRMCIQLHSHASRVHCPYAMIQLAHLSGASDHRMMMMMMTPWGNYFRMHFHSDDSEHFCGSRRKCARGSVAA